MNSQSPTPIEPARLQIRLGIRLAAKLFLYLVTFCTVLLAGAFQAGAERLDSGLVVLGLPFAVAMLGVIVGHCAAHFIVARHFGLKPDWPWVLPGFSLAGTSGFLDPLPDSGSSQKARVLTGLAGPAMGVVVASVLLAVGLHSSTVVEAAQGGTVIELGEPIIYAVLSELIVGDLPEGSTVLLNPVGFAGWIGLR